MTVNKMTNTKYAEILAMDKRTFSPLKKGKNMCSALTLVLFLIYLYPNPMEFLKKPKEKLEKEGEESA